MLPKPILTQICKRTIKSPGRGPFGASPSERMMCQQRRQLVIRRP